MCENALLTRVCPLGLQGEQGFFRIVMGNRFENLGIETECVWATPVLSEIM